MAVGGALYNIINLPQVFVFSNFKMWQARSLYFVFVMLPHVHIIDVVFLISFSYRRYDMSFQFKEQVILVLFAVLTLDQTLLFSLTW